MAAADEPTAKMTLSSVTNGTSGTPAASPIGRATPTRSIAHNADGCVAIPDNVLRGTDDTVQFAVREFHDEKVPGVVFAKGTDEGNGSGIGCQIAVNLNYRTGNVHGVGIELPDIASEGVRKNIVALKFGRGASVDIATDYRSLAAAVSVFVDRFHIAGWLWTAHWVAARSRRLNGPFSKAPAVVLPARAGSGLEINFFAKILADIANP